MNKANMPKRMGAVLSRYLVCKNNELFKFTLIAHEPSLSYIKQTSFN